MSIKGQALRALVVEKLVTAADEIFALFERTFAEYQDEILRSKLMQQPRVVLYREDIQTLTVGEAEPILIKQEVEPSVEIPLTSINVKTEERVNSSTLLQQDPAEKNIQDLIGEQCEEEEPGCSSDMDNSGTNESFDPDDSEDWEFLIQRITKKDEQELNASQVKDSEEVKANHDNSSTSNSCVMLSYDREKDGKLLTCTHCFESFESQDALVRHLEIHTKKRSIVCKICNKSFLHNSSYKQHSRIHSAQNPNRCSVCKRGFTTKYHLDSHMRMHTGERPFSCSDCGLRFTQRNAMKKHFMRRHSGLRPYTCSICQKGFVEKWLHVAHMVTKHSGK